VDIVYALILVVVLPATLAWIVGRTLAAGRWRAWIAVIGAAALPSIWLFYASRDADAITSSTAFYVVPIAFLFSAYFAFMGYRFGRPKGRCL